MVEYQVIVEVNKSGFGMFIDHIWECRSGGTNLSSYILNISSYIKCFFLPKQVLLIIVLQEGLEVIWGAIILSG